MAEQDRYGGYFGGKGKAPPISLKDFQGTSGAEQDRWASHFGRDKSNPMSGSSSIPIKNTPGSSWNTSSSAPGAEQERFGAHFGRRHGDSINGATVGILKSTLLPSFGLHSGLSIIAYTAGRLTDRAEAKDWVWPASQVANAWWSAIGNRMWYDNLSFGEAWSTLYYPEKVLLGGVSVWGLRLFYHIASRTIARGKDDPRYDGRKKDPEFWNKAAISMFLSEAAIQTFIALPFTLPFLSGPATVAAAPAPMYPDIAFSLAVFLFGTGFAMEVLADTQLASHRKRSHDLYREGVWSIVRHPNYLGDTHIHASFPVLLYSAGLLHPLTLLGPVANYVFLRYIGGDLENEASQESRYQKHNQRKFQQLQEYKREKNSFWPKAQELTNPWYLAVVGAGVGTVLLERGLRQLLRG